MNLLSRLKERVNERRGENFSDTEFRRIIEIKQTVQDEETGAEQEITRKAVKIITSGEGSRKNIITLVPMKSLSLEDFALPFSNTTKIREALRLQVMPFSAAGELELFPVVLTKTGRGVNGVVWYVSPEELELPYGTEDGGKIWPAPLPFISRLKDYNGTGVTMWIDEENICSLLWQENRPVLYRWRKNTGESSESHELSWYDSYCKARELERGGTFTVNVSGGNDDDEADEEFSAIVNDSVNVCSWISDVNLSRSALQGAKNLELIVRYLTRAALWLLVLGVIALSAELLRWNQVNEQIQQVRTRSENFYRQTFDPERTGRISNPVTLARDKIAESSGTQTEGHPLDEVLADVGDIFTVVSSRDITLDVVRYNADGLDCTGTGPDMSTILNFRKAWEDRGINAQVSNTQFVAGIGYRFELRVRW